MLRSGSQSAGCIGPSLANAKILVTYPKRDMRIYNWTGEMLIDSIHFTGNEQKKKTVTVWYGGKIFCFAEYMVGQLYYQSGPFSSYS